jgi:hypothetical protein
LTQGVIVFDDEIELMFQNASGGIHFLASHTLERLAQPPIRNPELRERAEFLKIRQGKARHSPKRGCRHFSTSGFFAQHKVNRSRAPQAPGLSEADASISAIKTSS